MRDVLDDIETLSKEDKQKIMTEYGKSIASYKDKNKTLEEENKSLKERSEKAPDLEKIKKEQFDLGKAEGDKALEDYKKVVALQKALGNTKAKDKALVSKLVNNDKISYELKDGEYEVKGLSDQIEEIKKTHEYLFEEEKKDDDSLRMSTGNDHQNSSKTKENATMSLGDALKEKINE